MKFFSNLKLKSKLLLLFTSINLLVTVVYSYYIYDLKSEAVVREIDARLNSAVHATPLMLPKNYVENALKKAIPSEEYLSYVNQLYAYCQKAKLKYVYIFVQRDSKIYYLVDTASPQEIAIGKFGYFNSIYADAPDEMLKSFKDAKPRHAEYVDQFGYFRSLFLPQKSKDGTIYLIGADVEISYVKKELFQALLVSIMLGVFVFLIGLLISLYITNHFTLPIIKLLNYTKRIQAKDYSHSVLMIDRKDEFFELSQAFEDMVKNIQSREAILESKLLSSIHYSSTIQNAILPDEKTIHLYFKDFFALWQPKDIVGGDIYLFNEVIEGESCLLVTVDCTGHGVGGAFVTMMIKSILMQITSEIVERYIICVEQDSIDTFDISPAEILQSFNRILKVMLNQHHYNEIQDVNVGFDGSIIYYNRNSKILKFAGAKSDLYYLENNQLKVEKGNKQSVGYTKSEINYKFTDHIFKINPNNPISFYLTTDGYLDQIGGDKEFPFGKKRFKALLESFDEMPFEIQQERFGEEIMLWQQEHEQNDDICVIGFTCK